MRETKTRRLLVIASTFPAHQNSYEPGFVAELCHYLSSKYSITVLTQSRQNALKYERVGNIDIVRYRYAPKRLELLSESGGISGSLKSKPYLIVVVPFMLASLVLHLLYYLRKLKPDIIHAHWIFPQAFCVSLAKLISSNETPVVCTSHGGDLYGLKGRFFHKIKNWTLKQINQLAVVSTAMKRYAESSFPDYQDQIHVLPMGVDLSRKFSGSIDRSYKQFSLLFVGRIVKKKGLVHLIHCLKHLRSINPNYSLVIVGEGPEKRSIEAEVLRLHLQDAVKFLGGVESSQLPSLYRQAHLAVFPFVQAEDGDMEGLGLVMIEAMGCYCPVVVGNVPAVHDVVRDRQSGFIVNPVNTEAFAATIDNAAGNKELLQSITKNAYQFAHEAFAWENCAERYHQLFEQT